MRTKTGCLAGCLMKLVLLAVGLGAFFYVLTITLNPWALHIGGRSTPLLYWHGAGTVHGKDGKSYLLYITFWPGKPGRHNGGRREGKGWSADLDGTGSLCISPGQIQRLELSGTMYGGYSSDADSLLSFRLLEWRKRFAINYQHRGFFDIAGTWVNHDLVMNRPNEQAIKFNTGPFLDGATTTLRWSTNDDFVSACQNLQTK
jgi:hypothetical protein